MSSTFLQIFLLLNVFLIGALTTLGVQHALAHFRPRKQAKAAAQPVHLPPAVRQQLLTEAAVRFQNVLEQNAKELQTNMKSTAGELNDNLQKIGREIISDEMKRYHQSLEELRAQTEITITGAQNEVKDHQTDLAEKLEAHKAELETKMAEELAAEKQRLIDAIDTRLADAVASFLIETLGHNVDLGAQSAYLTSLLEEHKDDFKRGVESEVSPTR